MQLKLKKLRKHISMKNIGRKKLLLTALLLILIVSAMGTIILSKIPVEVKREKTIYTLRHNFQYKYLVGLRPNTLYNKTVIGPNEVAYLPMSKSVNVTLTYKIASSIKEVKVSGNIKGVIVVEEEKGWVKEIEPIIPKNFNSTSFSIMFFIDIEKVSSLVNKIGKETGSRSFLYTLKIKPEVNILTELPYGKFEETYYPEFRIKIDHQNNVLKFEGEKYTFVKDEKSETTRPNFIKAIYWYIPVAVVKVLSYTALVVSSLGLMSLTVTAFKSKKTSEIERILLKYDDVLVNAVKPLKQLDEAIELNNFEDLVRIAANMSKPVFHTVKQRSEVVEHIFWVTDGSLTLKYITLENKATKYSIQRCLTENVVC